MEQWSHRTENDRWSLSYQELTSGTDNSLGFGKYVGQTQSTILTLTCPIHDLSLEVAILVSTNNLAHSCTKTPAGMWKMIKLMFHVKNHGHY